MDVKSPLTQGHRARWAAGTKANLTLQGYLDDHATDHRRGVWENKPAQLDRARCRDCDILVSYLRCQIAGFLAICYGLVIQVMALLNNRERDE